MIIVAKGYTSPEHLPGTVTQGNRMCPIRSASIRIALAVIFKAVQR
jgi:hypothetical protein